MEIMQLEKSKQVSPKQYSATLQTISMASHPIELPPMPRMPPLLEHLR